MKNTYTKIQLMYAVMVTFFVSVLIYLGIMNYKPSMSEAADSNTVSYTEGWTCDGNPVNITNMKSIKGIKAGEQFTIKNTLPDDLGKGNSLFFRSKNVFYSVYLDGEEIYRPNVPESIFYTDSLGTRWNSIELSPDDCGKTIEISLVKAYDSSRASIDNICIGDPGRLVLMTLRERSVAFITCILLIFSGLLLIIADIPINMQTRKNHELMYLGLFSLSIAAWCITETNLLQFFIDDSRLLQVISCSSLMLIPIPMIMYLEESFGFRYKWVAPVCCMVSAAEFITCWGLHLLGIADIHQTLIITHILLAVCAVILFYTIIRGSIISGKSQERSIYTLLRGIGLISLAIATLIDIIRFYCGISSDAALFVRIGMLIFIICYGSSSLENTINAVKLGVKTEFISKLAYQDGLTGAGNRTAFKEKLMSFETKKDVIGSVGIIMFDVNDLKFVNDNLGHQYGDSMIIKSAEIITSAFAPEGGECFRIGGDEFAVLLSGDNIRKRYEDGIERFRLKSDEHNSDPESMFRISIAHGFEAYDSSVHVRMMDMYRQADAKMYENKKCMKAAQVPPGEYYKDIITSS
ncbi:MAG: GGDEF domain-containing protein [Huintestinicola sp.]